MDILVLCTGNICRSPMAAALVAEVLRQRGVEATVHSAGLLEDGRPASPHSATLMADRGLDLSSHASRRVTAEVLARADLVIGMERRHVREAAVLVPGAWARSFTLPELARRASAAGPRPPETSLADWLGVLIEGRTTADHLGDVAKDEVADPIGRSLRVYRRCAEQIDDLIGVVVDHLWPIADRQSLPAVRSTNP